MSTWYETARILSTELAARRADQWRMTYICQLVKTEITVTTRNATATEQQKA